MRRLTNPFPAEHTPRDESEEASTARRGALRHQQILSIDMPTWREAIEAFDIKQSMIPHRKEQALGGPGAKGWYS